MKNLDDKLNNTLLKKAMGYRVTESVCEYGVEDETMKLLKKKISTKYYPPDVNALNLLLNIETKTDYSNLSDEELEEEKNILLKQIEGENENGTNGSQ